MFVWAKPAQAAGDNCPAARAQPDVDGAADGSGPIIHEVQAHSTFAAGSGGESCSIILDFQHQSVVSAQQPDGNPGGAAVPERVVERFLCDPVQVRGGEMVVQPAQK